MALCVFIALFSYFESLLALALPGMDMTIDGNYMAHGFCFAWEKSLVILHVASDIVTGVAYYSIPVAMFYFAYKRRDLPFYRVFILFAAFILACGTTHFLSAFTVFVPIYWTEGYVKAFTAVLSTLAVVLFIPRLPEAIALPSLQAKIDEVRKLNQTLSEQNEELEIANISIQNVLDPVYWIDQSARIWKVNESACRTLGYSLEELLTLSIPDLDPLLPAERWPAHWAELRRHGTLRFETRHRTREGRMLDVEVSATLIVHEGKEFNCAVARDITQRKASEAEIRRLNQGLEQRVADRTAELEVVNKDLESFAYSVSHDLRAPLRAIGGYGRILIEDHAAQLDVEGIRRLNIVCSEAGRMGQLLDGLLAFSRLGRQAIALHAVDLRALAQEVCNDCLAEIQDRRIEFRLLPLPPAQGDQILLRQVLVNLVSNAVKYTRPRDPAQIEIGGRVAAGEQVYWVKDNGVGFEMENVQKLFGVFQRLHTQAEFEGTGVGLAIVKRIVHRHGGRVWAEAAVDQGATVFFTLPLREA
jgi:PAS domain S-box-containing protein